MDLGHQRYQMGLKIGREGEGERGREREGERERERDVRFGIVRFCRC